MELNGRVVLDQIECFSSAAVQGKVALSLTKLQHFSQFCCKDEWVNIQRCYRAHTTNHQHGIQCRNVIFHSLCFPTGPNGWRGAGSATPNPQDVPLVTLQLKTSTNLSFFLQSLHRSAWNSSSSATCGTKPNTTDPCSDIAAWVQYSNWNNSSKALLRKQREIVLLLSMAG